MVLKYSVKSLHWKMGRSECRVALSVPSTKHTLNEAQFVIWNFIKTGRN